MRGKHPREEWNKSCTVCHPFPGPTVPIHVSGLIFSFWGKVTFFRRGDDEPESGIVFIFTKFISSRDATAPKSLNI